jgi:DNA-binding transcriptional LysR family regulator
MIEHRHIRAFVAVADERHFGHAAERLHQSQPALSRTINALEHAVGVPLLRRTTRRVELTPAGDAFLRRAQSLMAGLADAVDEAHRAAAGLSGTLTIAYMDFAILGVLPDMVARFRKQHPDIMVELRYSWTERQKAELLAGEIDVGFMIGPFHAEGVRTQSVDHQNFVAVLPEQHPLATAESLRLEELAGEPFVFGGQAEWAPLRETVFGMCNAAGFAPNIVQEAHSRDGIFGFVAAGLGITIYTDVARNGPRCGVVIRPLTNAPARVDVIAAWRALPCSPLRERFLAFLGASER